MIQAGFGKGPTSVGPLSRRKCAGASAPDSTASGKSMIHAGFGKGPTSVGPLSRRKCAGASAPDSTASGKSMVHAGFGKGPTSVGPLSRRKCADASAPEVSFSHSRRVFPQPIEGAGVHARAAPFHCGDLNRLPTSHPDELLPCWKKPSTAIRCLSWAGAPRQPWRSPHFPSPPEQAECTRCFPARRGRSRLARTSLPFPAEHSLQPAPPRSFRLGVRRAELAGPVPMPG